MRGQVLLVCALMLVAALSGCLSDRGKIDTDDEDHWAWNVAMYYEKPVRGVVRYAGDDLVWDVLIRFTEIKPDGTRVLWTDINVTVLPETGDPALPMTQLDDDDGVRTSVIRALFDEGAGDEDIIDPGDVIIVTSIGEDLRNGEIVLYIDTLKKVTVDIDMDWIFPLDHDIDFKAAEVELGKDDGDTVWTLDLELVTVTPDLFTLRWTDIEVRIKDPSGMYLLPSAGIPSDLKEVGDDIRIAYGKEDSGPPVVEVGDVIYMVFGSTAFAGSTVEFMVGDQAAATIILPEEFPEEVVVVHIASPSVQQMTRGITCWDVTLNINKISPKEVKLLWSEVRIIVVAASGSVMNQSTALTVDGGSYNNYTEFWYIETTSGDNKMSAGDAIRISGTSTVYEGAKVELNRGGQTIGSITLPTNFP